jgi:osmoprotectant transport system permease protein
VEEGHAGVISEAVPLLAQAGTVSCPPAPTDLGAFADAIDLVLHERESISGGVCIGGLEEFAALAVSHMEVSLLAILVAVAIAIPLGLWLGHLGRFEFLAVSVSNIGRAVPTLALLAFFVAFLGIGFTNVTIVLALLAIPPILTNTYVGVRQVSRETVDAARGQGLTEFQIVKSVELPLALPTIFAGLRTSAVAVVATATISPLANVESLGNPILEPQTYGDAGQLGAAIVVALITLATDAGLGLAQKVVTPRGLKVGQHAGGRRRKRFSLPLPNRTETT